MCAAWLRNVRSQSGSTFSSLIRFTGKNVCGWHSYPWTYLIRSLPRLLTSHYYIHNRGLFMHQYYLTSWNRYWLGIMSGCLVDELILVHRVLLILLSLIISESQVSCITCCQVIQRASRPESSHSGKLTLTCLLRIPQNYTELTVRHTCNRGLFLYTDGCFHVASTSPSRDKRTTSCCRNHSPGWPQMRIAYPYSR